MDHLAARHAATADRFVEPLVYGNVRSEEFEHGQRVGRRQSDVDVATDGRDADQIGVGEGQGDGDGVVLPGIAVEQDARSGVHAGGRDQITSR